MILLFVIFISMFGFNLKTLLFNTDYFFHIDGDVTFFNKTAEISLTKSLISLIVLTPLSLYTFGPTIALTPIGLTIINSYIYYGSITEISKLGSTNRKQKKKKKKKFDFKRYYTNRITFIEKVNKISNFQNKWATGLVCGACVLFCLITIAIIFKQRMIALSLLILLISFSFTTSFVLTWFNEKNKEVVNRGYFLDEYSVECLVGETPTFESFIEDVYSNVRLLVGWRKRNYRGDQFKLNMKCLKMINEIGEIKISVFKIINIMFSTGIIGIYRSFIDNLGPFEILFLIFINTIMVIIVLPLIRLNILVHIWGVFGCNSNSKLL